MALVVITGGARSGKSGAAQRLALSRHAQGPAGRRRGVRLRVRCRDDRPHRPSPMPTGRNGFSVIEATGSAGWLDEVPLGSLLAGRLSRDVLGTGACWRPGTTPLRGDTAMTDAEELPLRVCGGSSRLVAPPWWTPWPRARGTPSSSPTKSGRVWCRRSPPDASSAMSSAARTPRSSGLADAAYLAVGGRLLDLAALPRDVAWPED